MRTQNPPASARPLLTVAIPTYGRAALLDRQLAWFAEAVRGREHLVELHVSDNASTDETARVMATWRERLAGGTLRTRWERRPKNVGAIRNIAGCIRAARGEFVWTVSDDDVLRPDALRFVLDTLGERPDLALLVLNFSSRDARSGEERFARCFEVETDQEAADGRAIFMRHLAHPHPSRWGGLALTTALVYRSRAARAALASWPRGLDNLTVQLYVTGYCACLGRTLLTAQSWLEAKAGEHFFSNDARLTFRFRMADVPTAFEHLARLGYPRELCVEKIHLQRREFPPRAVLARLLRWPLLTTRVAVRYATSLGRLVLGRLALGPLRLRLEPLPGSPMPTPRTRLVSVSGASPTAFVRQERAAAERPGSPAP